VEVEVLVAVLWLEVKGVADEEVKDV